MEDKAPGGDWLNTVIMILEGGSGGHANLTGAHAPHVKPLRGAGWPVLFPPGMLEGVAPFVLLVVLIDRKAKADILSKGNTTPDARGTMDAGRLRTKPDKEVRGDVRGDTDLHTGF